MACTCMSVTEVRLYRFQPNRSWPFIFKLLEFKCNALINDGPIIVQLFNVSRHIHIYIYIYIYIYILNSKVK